MTDFFMAVLLAVVLVGFVAVPKLYDAVYWSRKFKELEKYDKK